MEEKVDELEEIVKSHSDTLREKLEKLPKWAKLYLEAMEREVERVRKALAQVGTGNTRIYWYAYEWNGVRMKSSTYHIPDQATVTFKIDGGEVSVSLTVSKSGEGLALYVNGDRTLRILPEASNAVLIEMMKR